MQFTWSQTKRLAKLKKHGLDFVDAPSVFEGVTFTFEDDRFSYDEQCLVTLGLLAGHPVSLIHTETDHEIRIISFRKATSREAQIYFDEEPSGMHRPDGSLDCQSEPPTQDRQQT